MLKLGSLFSGIGGFELGLERAIPNLQTVWQVEQNKFCQSILKKHWPNSKIYDDVCAVGAHNLNPVDILCGGFPCQDISIAGKMEGIHGKKSGLWFEMWRIISELRPRIIVLENVAAITFHGGSEVIASLAEIGYDAEWVIISARDFGAPHLRKRWFCVANSNSMRSRKTFNGGAPSSISTKPKVFERRQENDLSNSNGAFRKRNKLPIRKHKKNADNDKRPCSFWSEGYSGSKILRMDDGFSRRMDKNRLKALGNAIVPQCSEFIGQHIFNSGLLDD